MRKLLFLDIDGVLNSVEYFKSLLDDDKKLHVGFPNDHLDPKAIGKLNTITGATGAKIILSSTWRELKGIEHILKMKGVKGDIIGKTPDLGYDAIRGEEIQAWLNENKIYDSYVILDDDSNMLNIQKNNFIHINHKVGLTSSDAKKAIRILNNE